MSDVDKKQQPEAVRRLMEMGRRFLGGETKPQPAVERRAGMRVELSLPVQVRLGDGEWQPARIRDVNLTGLRIEPAGEARPGQTVAVQFEGYPGVAPAFSLVGRVSRVIAEAAGPEDVLAMAIQVDRGATAEDARKNYRLLVLHYVRHRPLLEDVDKGYFEGRCSSCGWVGRVGQRRPQCSHCGGTELERV
jgi:hypothetical protein